MPLRVRETSRITAKGQTTVPKAVRDALGVGYGGTIAFVVEQDRVIVQRAEAEATEDPVIQEFLGFLARDLERRPEAIAALDESLARRMASLTDGVDVDLDAPIEGETALER